MDLLPDFGNVLYTAAAFVVALSIIVFIHEFGHYIVGRWSGIGAEVFSLGFGPVLVSRVDRRGTRWQIAAIPLGGYVRFNGDSNAASAGAADEAELDAMSPEERRRTLAGAPLWARFATVAAGPVFNFILSVAIFAGAVAWQGVATEAPTVGRLATLPGGEGALQPGDRILALDGHETPDYRAFYAALADLPPTPTVRWSIERDGTARDIDGPQPMPPLLSGVMPSSAAAGAGLKAGDVITKVDGAPIWRFEDLRSRVGASAGAPLDLTVWRPLPAGAAGGTAATGAQLLTLSLTPKRMDLPLPNGDFETRWMIGATGDMAFAPETRAAGPLEALERGAGQVWTIVTSSVSAFEHMILGKISSCNLHGAVGIAQGSAAAAQAGAMDFIWFIGVLSTAVGFLNLFPVPVLDGGHLMFYLWEAVTRRPPSPAVLNVLTAAGMVAVLSLMLFGLWNDVTC